MTGGIIPLAATLASAAVFEAFAGDSKVIMHLVKEHIWATQDFSVLHQNFGAREFFVF